MEKPGIRPLDYGNVEIPEEEGSADLEKLLQTAGI